jgi:TetR/AcrR family transcriptional regulator, transcriptional repressor for nem operon
MTETSQKLLDAAEHRMRRGGYNAVSFRDLAADIDIKSASVHYHYPHKEDLGVALIKRYDENFFSALEKEVSGNISSQGKLEAYCDIYKQALTDDATICLCGMLGAESTGLPEVLRIAVVTFFEKNITWLKNALPSALSIEEKKVSAEQILATLQGAMLIATATQNTHVFDRISDQLITQYFGKS